jgi:hypothetical protein
MFQVQIGSVGYGKLTTTANTVIQQLVRPFRAAWTKVTGFKYSGSSTTHTGTFRMSIGTTTLSAAAATGQAVVNLTAQPTQARNVAASDFLVIEYQDTTRVGTATGAETGELNYDLVKVSSVSTLAITLTANCPHAYANGARVWLMSLDTDAIPGYCGTGTANTNPKYDLYTTAATELPSNALAAAGGLVSSNHAYEPLVFESNNATSAGTLEYLTAIGWIPAAVPGNMQRRGPTG